MNPHIESVQLSGLHPSPWPNANSMDPEEYALLVRAIRERGVCLQPPLVRSRKAGDYEIVDGAHRVRAAVEAGLKSIDVVVAELPDDLAMAIALGMNRLRGHMDLTIAAGQLSALAQQGWDLDKLALTGFLPEELEGLLQGSPVDADMLTAAVPDPEKPAKESKKPTLRLEFSTKSELDLVVAMALAHGVTVETGLLNMAKEAS